MVVMMMMVVVLVTVMIKMVILMMMIKIVVVFGVAEIAKHVMMMEMVIMAEISSGSRSSKVCNYYNKVR